MNKQKNKWIVYSNGLIMDEVFFTKDCDAEYVKTSLIIHDGYPSDIHVKKAHE